jgi:hypothetical protein
LQIIFYNHSLKSWLELQLYKNVVVFLSKLMFSLLFLILTLMGMMFFIYLLVVEILPENAQIRLYSLFVLLGFSNNSNAQFGFSHEVGVIAGQHFNRTMESDITLTPMPEIQDGNRINSLYKFSLQGRM